jgi:hypothetical protein
LKLNEEKLAKPGVVGGELQSGTRQTLLVLLTILMAVVDLSVRFTVVPELCLKNLQYKLMAMLL